MKTKFYFRLVMVCASFFFLIGISAQQTHLSIPIVDVNDDAEEILVENVEWEIPEGDVSLNSSDLEIYWDDVIQYVGVLFRDVQIPQGTVIDSAYIQFVCKSAGDDDITIQVYGIDSVTVDSIQAARYSISDKEPTTATLDWIPDPWIVEFDAKPAQRTPYLNTIVDEIVGNEGWESGNNMMFVLTGDVDEGTIRHAYSFDMDEEGPVLHVWFTEGGNTGSKEIQSPNFRTMVYPNPTEGKLYIENSSSDRFDYSIYSVSGRLVGSGQDISASRTEVDLSTINDGLYLIKVISGGQTETHKVVVR
jgi:Secretion system C-terminal sorting domain